MSRETVLAIMAPVAVFLFVWKVVRPDSFDAGGAFRAVGWDLTVLSMGLAFVATCVQGTRFQSYHSMIPQQPDKNLVFLVTIVLLGIVYGTAAWLRFGYLKRAETGNDPSQRLFWGAVSWALGISLCALFGFLSERLGHS
jgi:uncharacterized membrane protein YidH (DUF202 family)